MRAAVAFIALQTAFQAALAAPQFTGASVEPHGHQYPRTYTNSQLSIDEPSETFYEGEGGTAQPPPIPPNQNAEELINIPDDTTKNDGGSSQSSSVNGASKPDVPVGGANGGGSSGIAPVTGLGVPGTYGSGILGNAVSGIGPGLGGSGSGAPNVGSIGVNSANTAAVAGAADAGTATKPPVYEGDVSNVPQAKEPETQLVNLDEETAGSSGEVSPTEGEISQESSQNLDKCFNGPLARRTPNPPSWAKQAFREARDYAKSGKTVPGTNYPHEYRNFEKNFKSEGRLMEYPIDVKNKQGYSGGNPGKSRVIIREDAKGNWEFEGVIEHQEDGTFKRVC
ncbi:hypothetical protein BDV29DRAFT_163708 [Aspergillus leporis]|uniref:Uncharacterized protein n=1 Tax=Aspergillus leporis TaxID=41062 RepID=A0A5N5WJ38_9EURO|nr:hypothetical protein BDV29DRAFT_163708 [Aspergillus leporis]